MKTQAGVRLTVDTWRGIRAASSQAGVSAANLMDALATEWLMGYRMADPWALGVLGSAQDRQRSQKEAAKTRKSRKAAILTQNGDIPSEPAIGG